jgi:hypothetical protein
MLGCSSGVGVGVFFSGYGDCIAAAGDCTMAEPTAARGICARVLTLLLNE